MNKVEQGSNPAIVSLMWDAFEQGISYAEALRTNEFSAEQGPRVVYALSQRQPLTVFDRSDLFAWRYGLEGNRGPRVINTNINAVNLNVSEGKNGGMVRMFPLLVRGFGLDEIWGITRLSFKQISNILELLRKDEILARPTSGETIVSKIQLDGARKIIKGDASFTPEQENAFAFVRKAQQERLVSNTTTRWNGLTTFFNESERGLPRLYADRLRLELYAAAVANEISGDSTLMRWYRNTGRQLDNGWFSSSLVEDEEFIARNVGNTIRSLLAARQRGWKSLDIVNGDLVAR